ncbi:hypothetical protein ACFO5U_12595 [Planococcus dechangensis]|uniref:Uncharacterized protein n=1 Tax=Planococcus dechangensis TaxID=1176255 RepID=A0ABV9MD12_9BACL
MQAIVPAAHKLLEVDDNTAKAELEVEALDSCGNSTSRRHWTEQSERWNGKPVFYIPVTVSTPS